MAAVTPSNAFSVGKDITGILVSQTGVQVDLPHLTGVHFTPQYDTFKSKPLDGPTRQFDLPDGHQFSLKFDREDDSLDSFFAMIETAYWAVGGFVPTFTLYFYITERNGTQTTFEFSEVTVQYKPGEWKSGAPVSGSIDGFARFWQLV
jgi:hypothetical protein